MFQTRVIRTWETRSSICRRVEVVRGAIHFAWRGTGLPAGMSPKYFATFSFAVATSMSPASTTTVLAAP